MVSEIQVGPPMKSRSLRVMQVVSNLDVGGAQEVVRTLAENLSKIGVVSVVCTFKDGPLRQDIEALGIQVEILPERRYSVISLLSFIKENLEYRKSLKKIVDKHQIDIIQTHLLRSMDFLVLSIRSQNGPKVFWTFHNALFDLRADHLNKNQWLLKPKRFSHHLLYRIGSKYVDGIVAVSQDVKTSILSTMRGIPSEKITVICNCVDVERYGDGFNRDQIRRELGFGHDDQLGVVVATFKRQKGHQFLIEAASKLVSQFPNFHILFLGDGELREQLMGQTHNLDLDNHIHFMGTRSDVPSVLAASDLFILPSLWEGLPMALIEAMASELPVVATDVSGTTQVMEDGKTGILVHPGQSSELEDAVGKLLGDPVTAKNMGEASRLRVEKLFSAQKQANEYLELYKNHSLIKTPKFSFRGNQA
jgi:glycosyltransferase involved in cell wall biosynthesis